MIRGDADGVPPRWPSDRFDFVWVFDLQASEAWTFTLVPELVMPGDAEKPIGLET
ncbi:MAG TPA: hypothetical protein VGG79_09830 [Roseiarcus sp.]